MKLTRRTLALACLLLAAASHAQTSGVTLAINAPQYGFAGLQGSIKCISVNVTGGTSNRINWSVPGGGAQFLALGGASFPGSGATSISNGLPMQCIKLTAAPGTLSIGGSPGAYTSLTSPSMVTLQAQSVDDPTQTVTIPFAVAANTTSIRLMQSGYQQVFPGKDAHVTASVFGNADPTLTWSLVSSPAGSTPTLTDFNTCGSITSSGCRTMTLSSTTAGRYTVRATANADTSKSVTAVIYVTSAAAPSYSATPQHTRPIPCEVDPALTGAIYDVGPGQPYADLVATPAANAIPAGSMVRLHNADTTGASPTIFRNYYQIYENFTAAQPFVLCGVPDSAGNLPILDGSGSTGKAGTDFSGACYSEGVVCLYAKFAGVGNQIQHYPTLSGPSNITISGLYIRNARTTMSTYRPGDPAGTCSSGSCTWDGAASAIHIYSGQYIDVLGVLLENTGNGFASYETSANLNWGISQSVRFEGSRINQWGNPGSQTEHAMYFQSYWGIVDGNFIDAPATTTANPTSSASCMKWRGIQGVFRYNSCPAGVARDFDGVEVQDASPYVDLAAYLNNTSFYGVDASLDIVAGLQEAFYQGDWYYGNYTHSASGNWYHDFSDHDGYSSDRMGQAYVYNNTVDGVQTAFDIIASGQAGATRYMNPVIHSQNNVFGGTGATMGNVPNLITDNQTNVYQTQRPDLPFSPTPIASWYIAANGDGSHQLIVNAANSFTAGNSTWLSFQAFTGTAGACLNTTYTGQSAFPIQYSGSGNFQGPTTCPLSGSAGSPNVESAATVTQQLAAGWPRTCYYACPWPLTLPIESHQAGLSAANFIVAATAPYSATTFYPAGTPYTGSALVAGAALFPVRYEYDLPTYTLLPRTSPTVIGANDGGYTPPAATLTSITIAPSPVTLLTGATRQLAATCGYSDGSTTTCTTTVTWTPSSAAFTVSATGLLTAGSLAATGTVTAAIGSTTATATVTITAPASPTPLAAQGLKAWQGYRPN